MNIEQGSTGNGFAVACDLTFAKKKMNGYEALDFFSRVFTLAANVIVAGVCFTGFQKLRIRALKLIALSASIAVFASFADALLLQKATDTSTYSFLWIGITILWTIDIGLYALGVTKLIEWISRQKLGEQNAAGQPATRSESK